MKRRPSHIDSVSHSLCLHSADDVTIDNTNNYKTSQWWREHVKGDIHLVRYCFYSRPVHIVIKRFRNPKISDTITVSEEPHVTSLLSVLVNVKAVESCFDNYIRDSIISNSSIHVEYWFIFASVNRYVGGFFFLSKVVATLNDVGRSFNLFMATTGDVWIIPSFRIWDYVLHVEHISCVIMNCGQHERAIPSLSKAL